MKTQSVQQNTKSVLGSNSGKQASANTILQAYKKGTAQLEEIGDEEGPVQGKFETYQLAKTDEGPVQKMAKVAAGTDMVTHSLGDLDIKVTKTARKHKYKKDSIIEWLQQADRAAVKDGDNYTIPFASGDGFLGYTFGPDGEVVVKHCGPFGKAVTTQL